MAKLRPPLPVQAATRQPSSLDEHVSATTGVYCVPQHGTITHAASVVLNPQGGAAHK
jgi:hypothetical protein